ncbi:MAG: hypothetical protein HZB42_01545 [Sphingobacteriales bacterium]|nr:hypothetical protein [Sphingobacteriales bacterium]
MQLHIGPNRFIGDIQKEFNKAFPFLKIEFFNNKTFNRSGFMAHQIIPQNKKIGESQLNITDGDIQVEKDMKVKDLEKIFKDQFSLAVQVFRKSGNLWLETTMTDNWTLQQQNNHGREISTGKNADEKPGDYDLNRDAGH